VTDAGGHYHCKCRGGFVGAHCDVQTEEADHEEDEEEEEEEDEEDNGDVTRRMKHASVLIALFVAVVVLMILITVALLRLRCRSNRKQVGVAAPAATSEALQPPQHAKQVHQQVHQQVPEYRASSADPVAAAWGVGDIIDVETADGWERDAIVVGASSCGDPSQLRIRFTDGVEDDWIAAEFVKPEFQPPPPQSESTRSRSSPGETGEGAALAAAAGAHVDNVDNPLHNTTSIDEV